MDNASKNAGDMITSLQMKYNRGRQAAITNELVDIITGAFYHLLVGYFRRVVVVALPILFSSRPLFVPNIMNSLTVSFFFLLSGASAL